MTNKLLTVMMATSTFALSGCIGLIGMGVGAVLDSGKGKRAEADAYSRLVNKHAELEKTFAELPEDMEELEKAANQWSELHNALAEYRTREEFNYEKYPSCLSKDRKNSSHCKKAVEMKTKSAHKLAQVLHAAIEAKPLPGSNFPALHIALAQDDAELAAIVDVEASLTKVTQQWSAYWTKRVKKSGGAETLVRKGGTGMCFFSTTPQSNEIQPNFAFGLTDDMFLRCVAPQALSSYQRTQKDTVAVSVVNHHGRLRVDTLPGGEDSESPSHTGELSTAAFRKAAKSSDDERSGPKKELKPWRFAVVDVTYTTSRKVGTRAIDSGNDVRFEDDIRETEIASGIAIVDMEAQDEREEDDDGDNEDAEETASEDAEDEDEDAAEVEAKAKSAKKSKAKAKAKKAKQAKSSKKTRTAARSSRRS